MHVWLTEDAENRLEGVKEEEAEENEDEEGKEEMETLKPDVTFEAKSSTDFSQSEGSTSHNPNIFFLLPFASLTTDEWIDTIP